MSIVCLSRDSSLIACLEERYGASVVSVPVDGIPPEGGSGPEVEVLVVDITSYELPAMPPVPLIALTAVPSLREAVRLLQSGVRGYGNRKMRKENLFQVVESVKTGQIWLPPDILNGLIDLIPPMASTRAPEDRFNELSKRELEVAGYVTQGMSNKVIAEKMFVSLRTVKAHLSAIYDKTGLRNRLELGLYLKGRENV